MINTIGKISDLMVNHLETLKLQRKK